MPKKVWGTTLGGDHFSHERQASDDATILSTSPVTYSKVKRTISGIVDHKHTHSLTTMKVLFAIRGSEYTMERKKPSTSKYCSLENIL